MHEMKNAPFSSSRPWSFFDGDGTCCFHTVFYSVLCFSHDVITPPPPPHPPFCKQQRNFQRNTIFQPSNIFQDSTSSNALHMTLLHPPHPPTPPSVNNNETFNVTPSSNQATSSRIQHHPTHFTWRYYTPPHPHPPDPPSLYKNDLYGIASRLRVPRSSGEPPALSLYIFLYTYIYIHICIYIYIIVNFPSHFSHIFFRVRQMPMPPSHPSRPILADRWRTRSVANSSGIQLAVGC